MFKFLVDATSSAIDTSSKTPILDGNKTYAWSESAVASLVAILLVFVVLVIIIALTHLIFKGLGYLDLKKEIDEHKKDANCKDIPSKPSYLNQFNENDDDMMAAILVATIDYQNEIKKDVKLVSVKEIK